MRFSLIIVYSLIIIASYIIINYIIVLYNINFNYIKTLTYTLNEIIWHTNCQPRSQFDRSE